MTTEQSIINAVEKYKKREISLPQLGKFIASISVLEPKIYNQVKEAYFKGWYDPYLPDELKFNRYEKNDTKEGLKILLTAGYEKTKQYLNKIGTAAYDIATLKNLENTKPSGNHMMTIQEAIIGAVNEYKAGRITVKQLKTAIKIISVTNRDTFESLKKNYMAGQYDSYLPEELKSTSNMNDADDNALPAVREYNAIKRDYESGKINLPTVQTKLLELGQKYPGAVMTLLKYNPKVDSDLTGFFSQNYSIAKAAVTKGIELGEKIVDTAGQAAGQIYTDIKSGASTMYGDTIGQMKYIIPIVLIGGGLLVYKLLTSDTAKTVASRV